MMVKRLAWLVLATVLVIGWVGVGSGEPALAAPEGAWAELIGPLFARYAPGTEQWALGFGVVADGWAGATPELESIAVTLDGRPLAVDRYSFSAGGWAGTSGAVRRAEIVQLKRSARAHLRGAVPDAPARPNLEDAGLRLAGLLAASPVSHLTISGTHEVAPGVHQVELTLVHRAGHDTVTLTETVEVLVAAVPSATGWFAADLHMHSTFSDGNQSVAGLKADLSAMGYRIGYVTDHTSSVMSAGVFDSMTDTYPSACQTASDVGTSMFPGGEMAVGHRTWLGWNGDGHSLAYGVTSTAGLNDNYWGAQTGLDQINGNNSPLSSPGIAHPTHTFYPWENWTVLRYNGIELMCGYQWYFDLASGPASRWRSECARLQSYSESFRPSVRTGSDYHSSWYPYVTHIYLGSDEAWTGADWTGRWTAVSAALRDGRTAISRKGSLAYLTADGHPVGTTLVRATGTQIGFGVHFQPIESGSYTLTLYRDNCAATVWSVSASLTAGSAYTWNVSHSYPGSSHYYWLYVSGPDFCYTTPIYAHP